MKFFKLMMIALVAMVAMVGMSSCSQSSDSDSTCDHNFIEHDYSKDIVGTWTVLLGNYADAMVIKADGTMNRTIVVDGKLVEYSLRYELVSNQITLFYENGDVEKGRVDVIPDVGLSITLDDKTGDAYKFFCCEKDLSDEILGMWVCNDGPSDKETDMVIQTFKEDGTVTKSGWSVASNEFIVNETINYKVVGDLIFHQRPSDMVSEGVASHFASKLTYMPNANQLGDMLTNTAIKVVNGEVLELSMSMLRVKQSLNLTDRTYDYVSAYVSNAKGADEDFSILGNTFNISKIKSNDLDMMFRSILSCIELNENTIKFTFNNNDRESVYNDPITVDGNKVTVDMSFGKPAYRKVEMYMFQDADDCQLHIYMPTKSFINYFANLQIPSLVAEDKIDLTDDVAIEKVFDDMEARIESINVSFVLKARE